MTEVGHVPTGSPAKAVQMPLARILVGLDGSAGSERALHWAVGRAADTGAEVVAVHVLAPLDEFLVALPPLGRTNWAEDRRRQLDEDWCQPLRDAGVAYRARLEEDNPAAGLRRVADEEEADLIVVGAQGHGGVGERLLGSVSYKLAHAARHPVVIVPSEWNAG